MTVGIIGIVILGLIALVQSLRVLAYQRLMIEQVKALVLAAKAIDVMEARTEAVRSGLLGALAALKRRDVDGLVLALDQATSKPEKARGA